MKQHKDEKQLIIADGAAFGPEIDRVLRLAEEYGNAALYLPESFEWMLLRAGIIEDKEIARILEEPSEYIESKKYFSWERYFTDLLIKKTTGTYLAYAKKTLNSTYLNEKIKETILRVMNRIEFKWKI